MSDAPVLTVIVGTRDRPDGLRAAVDSVAANTRMPWEILVGDAYGDAPVFGPVLHDRRVSVVRERPRLGFSKGMNRLARLAAGEWVAWLNDDAEVEPGWADEAVEFLRLRRDVGIGAFRWSDPGRGFGIQSWHGVPCANFGVLRKEIGDSLGWFDEDLWMYGADTALSVRCWLAGLRVEPLPGPGVVHRRAKDSVREANEATAARDQALFEQKYGAFLARLRSAAAAAP